MIFTTTTLATKYITNLVKRVANGEHIAPSEIANAPKLIDKVYGDGDGVLEFSDVVDAVTEIGSNVIDKVGDAISFISDWF